MKVNTTYIMSLSNWGINSLLKWRVLLIHVSTAFSPPNLGTQKCHERLPASVCDNICAYGK